MRDPHLVYLRYRLLSPPTVSYRDPAPLDFTNEFGHFTLAAEELRWEPAAHFSSKGRGTRSGRPIPSGVGAGLRPSRVAPRGTVRVR